MGVGRTAPAHLALSAVHPPPPPPPPPPEEDAGSPPGRPAAGARTHRARRSAQREPAFVERSEVPEDAAGRVEIFTIPAIDLGTVDLLAVVEDRAHPETPEGRVGRFLSSDLSPVALAVLLLVVLLVGLKLTR